ncbi:MAG TPA: hypothetical protein VLL52_09580 [Anaerolineae bacterium]|nr:hypothetical protein [Anaerolineae bacterium]
MRHGREPDIFENKKQLLLVLIGLIMGGIVLSMGSHWVGVLWTFMMGGF